MQIQPFERDSKLSNAISNHSKGIGSIRIQIRTIRKGFEAFECKFEKFERDTKHSNVIRSIRMQIRTIRKIFEEWNANSTIRKGFEAFKCNF